MKNQNKNWKMKFREIKILTENCNFKLAIWKKLQNNNQ